MQHVLVMGVSGVGKSTVAAALAEALGARFVEADRYHPPDNVARMSRGEPLGDTHREGWLDSLAAAAAARPGRAVIACSALKARYRNRLEAVLGGLLVVHLAGTRGLLAERIWQRVDHFMPASLLDSQFADLEPPEGPRTVEIDVALPLQAVIDAALDFVQAVDRRIAGG